ncbi:type IX secretion system membrane protein PorP/SprF [Flavobacterium sp.]|uniref:PorP/SprF family type IX secretion system membrane protein n=1 Tax=Flavobacterium sp. TaxID=239 RepID=UPI00121883E1|nr:type IX secretion system membrane protein PorP/SprF [Flavobacterium sp.]RZJ71351.1 MAG: type IX secretion system membrane protein PorP/SprF [Flavobacterium sp.]
MNFKKRYLFVLLFLTKFALAQEGVAVYSDYLTDNYYLIHPSMAGAANCAKVRATARAQWFGEDDAPALQTISFNGRVGERSGAGIIVFNDRNGYHSQTGVKLTYAHHIMFSRDEVDLNQLSFGVNVGLIQSRLDETSFREFDPNVTGTIIQKDSYFNVDLGASYNFLDFYAHLTVKNVIETRREIYTGYESDNLRKFLLSLGYVFGDEDRLLWEPSVLFQYTDETAEKALDVNLKVYKTLDWGRLWGGLSYRRQFDGAEFLRGGSREEQHLQYFTPLVGINYKNFMFAYTYSYLTGDAKFSTGGFHQITLGFNLFCQREKYHCNCPAVN